MSRWAQFVALGLGQLRRPAEPARHRRQPARIPTPQALSLGAAERSSSRSSLARVNAQQPYTLYEALFGRLLARCAAAGSAAWLPVQEQVCTRWTRRPFDLCLAALPVGVVPAHVKARSSCTSAWTRRDICQRSSDVYRRQDRRRHGGPHVDVPGRQRGGGQTARILISGGSISSSNGGFDLCDPPEAERAL